MPPICHIIPRFSDRPLFYFLLLLGGFLVLNAGLILELPLLLLRDYAAEPNLDGSIEEELILEMNLLLEGKAPNMDIQLAEYIEVKDVAIVEVET